MPLPASALPIPPRPAARRALLPVLGAVLALAGCAGMPPSNRASWNNEDFATTTTHTRDYPTDPTHICEAARRALLSQGFFISMASAEQVSGRKNFQPAAEVHAEMEMRVVCTPASGGVGGATAFATAVQDRYELKKVANSASVGVGAIGSLSLPLPASNDALVKVASETLTDDLFYERFFTLLERYLPAAPKPARRTPARATPPAETAPVATPVSLGTAPRPQALAPTPAPEPAAPADPAPAPPPAAEAPTAPPAPSTSAAARD